MQATPIQAATPIQEGYAMGVDCASLPVAAAATAAAALPAASGLTATHPGSFGVPAPLLPKAPSQGTPARALHSVHEDDGEAAQTALPHLLGAPPSFPPSKAGGSGEPAAAGEEHRGGGNGAEGEKDVPHLAPWRPKEYKCKRCGAPKKGHICLVQRDMSSRERDSSSRKEWGTDEDSFILRSVEIIGCRWRHIAASLPGRSDDAVRNRWNRLREQVDPMGNSVWGCAPSEAPRRKEAEPAAAERKERAKPERVSWTPAEDHIIAQSVAELGHRWFLIAERLPGRTDHAIRNRWHRLQSMQQDMVVMSRMKQGLAMGLEPGVFMAMPMNHGV